MAMLRAMQAHQVARSVTLLFGARTQADLYLMDELRTMATHWAGTFTLLPVLSDATDDTTWTGAHGLVTGHLSQVLEPGMHAYLCGPPGMIDAASTELQQAGLPKAHIHADRFTTRHDALALADTDSNASEIIAPPKGLGETLVALWHYLKFFLFHVQGLSVVVALFAGGGWITLALAGAFVGALAGARVKATCFLGTTPRPRATAIRGCSPCSYGWRYRCCCSSALPLSGA